MNKKIGIVGNQKGWDYEFVRKKCLEIGIHSLDTIISGGAKGVDTFAQMIAEELGCTIIIHYPRPDLPSPYRYFQRNSQVANECGLLIAFDKKSGRAGTKNTISEAKKAGKKVILFNKEV